MVLISGFSPSNGHYVLHERYLDNDKMQRDAVIGSVAGIDLAVREMVNGLRNENWRSVGNAQNYDSKGRKVEPVRGKDEFGQSVDVSA